MPQIMRATLSWLTIAASAALVVTANHTMPLGKRDTAYLDSTEPLPHDKRSAGSGCSAYPLDLSAAIPYVRFVAASSDAEAEGDFRGMQWTIGIAGCPSVELHSAMARASKAQTTNTAILRQCQTFLLRELPGRGEQQTFAIQVAHPTTFFGWSNEKRAENADGVSFRFLDPLWTPIQRFKLDCTKTYQKGQSGILGQDCLIKGKKDHEEEVCFTLEPVADVSSEQQALQWKPCGEVDPKLGRWNIHDASADFSEMPTYTYATP